MNQMQDMVAIVTGASRGIGKAVAAELLRRGANVTITARKPEPLVEAARELQTAAAGDAEVLRGFNLFHILY